MSLQPLVDDDIRDNAARLMRSLIGKGPRMLATDDAYWTRQRDLRISRDKHAAKRTPHFIAQFSIDPQKLSEALDHANDRRKFPQVFAAYMAGDTAEFGRLLSVAMAAYVAEQASEAADDAADEEAWNLYDDGGDSDAR